MINTTDDKVDSITAKLIFDGSDSFIINNGDPAHIVFSISGNDITVVFDNYGNGFQPHDPPLDSKTIYFEVVSDSVFTVSLKS